MNMSATPKRWRPFVMAAGVLPVMGLFCVPARGDRLELHRAVIVVRPGRLANAESAAATVLAQEIERRTGILLSRSTEWPTDGPAIALTSRPDVPQWPRAVPRCSDRRGPEHQPEGFRLLCETAANQPPVVWIVGADPRGVLFGAGRLLRQMHWAAGTASIPESLDIVTAPVSRIRGHQLGYRNRANSWDAWDVEQFEQYIRDLAVFGTNAIENIPFQDQTEGPLMHVPRDVMNRGISEICDQYGLDYWVWTPAVFDLRDNTRRAAMLTRLETLFGECPRLDGVFFPGGDPGHNPPEQVLPFLEDVAVRLRHAHPEARIWLSLQNFNSRQIDTVFSHIEHRPLPWLGGLVAGPSSPPLAEMRRRLPPQYGLRMYPDITHNKLCQFPVPWWDQAYALTLGREAINPRPVQYARIHHALAPLSDGFITYSDGVHDDVNKVVWSLRGWDPGHPVRDMLVQYARYFFGPQVAETAADGILALEKNWQGPLAENASVDGTRMLWQRLEERAPHLEDNWRWQMNVLRSYCDVYLRHRLLHETRLEQRVNNVLARSDQIGADRAMQRARTLLTLASTAPPRPQSRRRIEQLCQNLFDSISLQTSVDRYHASAPERGAFLDFIDYPLNNRWWLEDQFDEIAALPSELAKQQRLRTIATWEDPGPGSYYDDIGHVGRSPRVWRSTSPHAGAVLETPSLPTFWWWDSGRSRARLSWQCTMDWPPAVVYAGLDPQATYTVRLTGYGKFLLKMDGAAVTPRVARREIGQFNEFPVPPRLIDDRRLVVTWDVPTDESDLNWRQQSRVAEIWLLKK